MSCETGSDSKRKAYIKVICHYNLIIMPSLVSIGKDRVRSETMYRSILTLDGSKVRQVHDVARER